MLGSRPAQMVNCAEPAPLASALGLIAFTGEQLWVMLPNAGSSWARQHSLMKTTSPGLKPEKFTVTTSLLLRPLFGVTVAAPKAGAADSAVAATAAATPARTFRRMRRWILSLGC